MDDGYCQDQARECVNRVMDQPTTQTATITVRKPCTCGAARWFLCAYSCPSLIPVAEYDCDGIEDSPLVPTAASVAWVRAQHPHDDLIYIG